MKTYSNGNRTIKNILVSPKNKEPIQHKSCIIYYDKGDRVSYNEQYIGESGRTFGERYTKHCRRFSPTQGNKTTTGHLTTMENFNIIGRESHGFIRTIKESIYFRVNQPTLNRNIGKYKLPHILDAVLINTPEL